MTLNLIHHEIAEEIDNLNFFLLPPPLLHLFQFLFAYLYIVQMLISFHIMIAIVYYTQLFEGLVNLYNSNIPNVHVLTTPVLHSTVIDCTTLSLTQTQYLMSQYQKHPTISPSLSVLF